jgi:ABC-2 type transport system permease protein
MALEGGIDLRARAWYNPNLSSQVYNVPGVIGLLLVLMALLLTALAVVRERELGTLEQLMVSPISPEELILGKTVPVMIICLVDLALITVVALLWFHIPLRGPVGALVLASVLYILAGLGAGLFISAISRTQQEAFLTMFLFILPGIILSGFMYPIATMPDFFQHVTLLNPIRYFMEMVRGIFLKGQGVTDLWSHYVVLTGMALGAFWGASRRFKKSL